MCIVLHVWVISLGRAGVAQGRDLRWTPSTEPKENVLDVRDKSAIICPAVKAGVWRPESKADSKLSELVAFLYKQAAEERNCLQIEFPERHRELQSLETQLVLSEVQLAMK